MTKLSSAECRDLILDFLEFNPKSSATKVRNYLLDQGVKVASVNQMSKVLRHLCVEGVVFALAQRSADHIVFSTAKKFKTRHTNGIAWGMEHILMAEKLEFA
jgi:hypothetical protein